MRQAQLHNSLFRSALRHVVRAGFRRVQHLDGRVSAILVLSIRQLQNELQIVKTPAIQKNRYDQ